MKRSFGPAFLLLPMRDKSTIGAEDVLKTEFPETSLVPLQTCLLRYGTARPAILQQLTKEPPVASLPSNDKDDNNKQSSDDYSAYTCSESLSSVTTRPNKRDIDSCSSIASSICSSDISDTQHQMKKCCPDSTLSNVHQEPVQPPHLSRFLFPPRVDHSKPSIDELLYHPLLFQSQMNKSNAEEFAKTFRGFCEEGFVVMAHYVDETGQQIHKEVLKCWIGWVQYKRHLEELFHSMVDAVFMVIKTSCSSNDREIVICSDFLYCGTYLMLQSKSPCMVQNSEKTSFDVPVIMDHPNPVNEWIDFSNVFHLDQEEQDHPIETSLHKNIKQDDEEESVEFEVIDFGEDNLVGSQVLLSSPSLDDCAQMSANGSRSNNALSSKLNSDVANTSEFISPSEDVATPIFVLKQFIPCNVKDITMPSNSVFARGKSMEVQIKGKFTFYINKESFLIRRLEFAYQQDDSIPYS